MTEIPNPAAQTAQWLRLAEEQYQTAFDLDDAQGAALAAAIAQVYATLELADATRRVAMAAEEATK